MHTHCRSQRINQAFAKWWRKMAGDKCPDARKERIRREHVGVAVALYEDIRRWKVKRQKSRIRQIEHG